MTSYRRAIPSLNALMTFEAAARLGSFTLASRELGVTQAAVSRQIQALERDFGVLLFQRSHRKVDLTASGVVLAGTLKACFEQIRETADLIREPAQTDSVTVGATIAFSHFWLLPRIAEFRALHPDIAIRIVTQDLPFDLASENIDAIIGFGDRATRGGELLASVSDVVYPVCSPLFRARFNGQVGLSELKSCPLTASDAPDRTWLTWSQWFAAVQGSAVPVRPSLRFTNYTDCVQAAIAGQGVALGWDFLLRRLVEAGQLVRLSCLEVRPQATYQLVAPNRRQPTAAAAAFTAWAAAEFGRHSAGVAD